VSTWSTNHCHLTALTNPYSNCNTQSGHWRRSTSSSFTSSNCLMSQPHASQFPNNLLTHCNHNHAQTLSTTARSRMYLLRPRLLPPILRQAPLQPLAPCQITYGTLIHHPAPIIVPCKLPWSHLTKQTTIPNWAKPAVPPASNLVAGKFCTGKTLWPHHDWKGRPLHSRKNTDKTDNCNPQNRKGLPPPALISPAMHHAFQTLLNQTIVGLLCLHKAKVDNN